MNPLHGAYIYRALPFGIEALIQGEHLLDALLGETAPAGHRRSKGLSSTLMASKTRVRCAVPIASASEEVEGFAKRVARNSRRNLSHVMFANVDDSASSSAAAATAEIEGIPLPGTCLSRVGTCARIEGPLYRYRMLMCGALI